jgi:O-antigen/teichoic acid export membrane protein
LIATWLGLSDFGLAVTALVIVVVALGVLYGFVMPYLRKRRSKSSADDRARSSGGFTS